MRYTNQTFFDAVAARAKDKRQAMSDPINCAYRAPNGLKCFIGVCIPDDQYSSSMEGKPLARIHVPALRGVSQYLLAECQHVHDRVKPEDWQTRLAEIASDYSLVIN